MDAMDGREPVYTTPNTSSEDCMYFYDCSLICATLIRFIAAWGFTLIYINYKLYCTAYFRSFLFIIFIASLDDIGFAFINRCIQAVETRGTM